MIGTISWTVAGTSWASFRPPVQIFLGANPCCIQIDLKKYVKQKTARNVIFASRIQVTLRGGLKCDYNQIEQILVQLLGIFEKSFVSHAKR